MDDLHKAGALDSEEHKAAMLMIGQHPTSEGDDLVRVLRGLYDLYKAGALSEAEFNTKKWDLLSKS